MPKEISKDELYQQNGAYLVAFYTPSCPHCRVLEKSIESLETQAIPVYKINLDKEPQLSSEFSIRSVPVLIRFENGKETARRVGSLSKDEIKLMMA